MDQSRQLYRTLCREEYIPWYATDWWLDAACGPENWNAATVLDKHNRLIGALPFTFGKKAGLPAITLPPWTANLHVWIRPSESNRRVYQYGHEQSVLRQLISQLPDARIFDQQYDTALQNMLPFHWAGYRHTTRYTYRFTDLSEPARLYREMDTSTRNHIRKARETIQVIPQENPEDLIRLLRQSFQRKSIGLPADTRLPILIDCLSKNAKLTILSARNTSGQIIASIAIVQDARQATYWLSGADTEGRQSGSISLLLWEGIKLAAREVNTFDFEGSMAPGVESLFRSFGAVRTPYHRVYRTRPRLLELLVR